MQAERSRAGNSLLPGFGVLLDKEILEATRSKRFLIFLAVMSLLMALVVLIAYANVDYRGGGARHSIREDDMDGLMGTWAGFIGYLGSLMVLASTVDAMPHERALGISGWIVTKPVSRASYLIAKSVGHAITAIISIVIVPTLFFVVLSLLLFEGVPLANVLGATLVLILGVTFLAFLNVAIGIPLKTVTPVAVVSLAIWFAPNFLPAVSGLEWTVHVLPSYLPLLAILIAARDSAMDDYAVSIPLSTIVTTMVVTGLAIVWFERQEL